MGQIDVRVLGDVEDGVEVGSEGCACGDCRPTATIYRDDPTYERHDPRLAQGPCCCGRFFVVAHDERAAERRAQDLSAERNSARKRPHNYGFRHLPLELPWGAGFHVVVADLLPPNQEPAAG